jgi:hypothetical protein
MLIKTNQLLYYIIFAILITITTCEYRSIDGGGNNRNFPSDGVPKSALGRENPKTNYGVGAFQMVPTPGNYGELDPKMSCADPLPADNFPLPRCVSNLITAMKLKNDDSFNLAYLDKYKSKRKCSHLVSWFVYAAPRITLLQNILISYFFLD